MSERIEVYHRGHKITYAHNGDVWDCYELELRDYPTLGKLKAKIDKIYLALRKQAGVECVYIGSYGSLREISVTIIEFDKTTVKQHYGANKGTYLEHKVMVMGKRRSHRGVDLGSERTGTQ